MAYQVYVLYATPRILGAAVQGWSEGLELSENLGQQLLRRSTALGETLGYWEWG